MISTMRHQVLPAVNVFIVKDDKVLLGRRSNTGWMDGKLCAPGGHIEQGESPTTAIIREIEEELGITVLAEDLEFLCIAARNSPPVEYASYEFVIRDKGYEVTNNEPELCSELVWADMHNLPSDVIDDFRQIIEQSLIQEKVYLELGY
jgi:8-oxo-dGTP diphosphatase